MCCRYYMEMSPELRPIVEAARRSSLADKMVKKLGRPLITSGEVRPTDIVPVIAPGKNGERCVFPMIWGFRGKSVLFNARSETAGAKPTFREAWQKHRCIVPASWYYEWQHFRTPDGKTRTGDRFMIQPRGSEATWLCGLYRIEEGFPYFVVLTREPSEALRMIHNRMPVILPSACIDAWIDPGTDPEGLLPSVLTDLVFERSVPAPGSPPV